MESNDFYLEMLNEKDLDNINKNDKELIQLKFWGLLGKITEKYTMGDSSSIPIKVAEELLKSICFLLKREMRSYTSVVEVLKSEDFEILLEHSKINIKNDINRGEKLLQQVIETSTGIENISYIDTVMEIGKGLKRYDYNFFAHKIDFNIDYQLSNPVSEELQGIEFVNEYLKRLLFENKFCNKFNKEKIIWILKSYCKDYKELLINIFEPVLTNIIGLSILDRDIFHLEITENEIQLLKFIFKDRNIREVIIKAVEDICKKMNVNNDFEIEYIKMTALNIIPRINEAIINNNLQNIFLDFNYEEEEIKNIFVDNKSMDDDSLRKLIEKIENCTVTKDKVRIINDEVGSLEDLIEILNNCIWQDEVEELINNIGIEKIHLLKYYLDNKINDNISNTQWENKFQEVIDLDLYKSYGLE